MSLRSGLDSILACQLPKIAEDYPESDTERLFQWLSHACGQLMEPDLTVFLRVSDEELKQRIELRSEQATESDFTIFEKRQTIYDRLAAENRYRWLEVVNDKDPQAAAQIIFEEVKRRLGGRL